MLIFILDGSASRHDLITSPSVTEVFNGSDYIRGVLPTKGLERHGVNVKYVTARQFNVTSVGPGDTVVFVKYDRLGQAKAVKDTGAKVVLDVVDSKKHWKQHREYLDALIVNTRSQVEIITHRDKFDKPIFKIPHIMTNFSPDMQGQTRRSFPNKLSTIGYLGVPATFTNMQHFEEFCAQHDYEWYTRQPSVDTNERYTMRLDLGCIYYTGDTDRVGGTITMSKPSAKLINLFSYGIPTLYTPYESYLDEIGVADYPDLLWGCCNTPAAMFDKINILSENMDFYYDLSDQAYHMSRRYHISNTEHIYKDLLEYSSS
jgi:hypothetical protein